VQERLLRGTANFPGKSGEGSHSSAVFANLDRAIRGEFLEAGLQLDGEVHAKEYKGNNYLVNYSFLGVNRMPETRTKGC
jgi:hypothetical protein